jgi:hypothetical protein
MHAAVDAAVRFPKHTRENGCLVPRRVVIAYGGALFEATFGIAMNGEIEMLNDSPLIADLPITRERYGEGDLFVLRPWKRSERRPAPRSWWQRGEGSNGGRPAEALADAALNGAPLAKGLDAETRDGTIVIEGRDVVGALVLGAPSKDED